jgi:hypothetical protein
MLYGIKLAKQGCIRKVFMVRRKFVMKPRKSRRFFLWPVFVIVSLFAIYYISFSILAYFQEAAVSRKWAETLLDPSTIPGRFPKRAKNSTAFFLEETVKQDHNRFELKGFRRDVPWKDGWNVLQDEFNRPTDRIYLPEDVMSYLSRHEADFSGIYEKVRDEAPEWEIDPEDFTSSPVDRKKIYGHAMLDLSANITLVKLIAIDVLGKTVKGETREALEAFDCAWIINRSIRNRPDRYSQVIGMWIDGMLSRVIRKMRDIPPKWQERILEHDYRKTMMTAFAMETWRLFQVVNSSNMFLTKDDYIGLLGPGESEPFTLPEAMGIVITKIGRPYFRLCAIDALEKTRQEILILQGEDICRMDPSSRKWEETVARWNIIKEDPFSSRSSTLFISHFFIPNFVASWRSAQIAMFKLEATQKILQIKERKRALPGGRLERDVFVLPSSMCRDREWICKTYEDGAFSLSYSGKVKGLFESEKKGADLSIEWQTE